MAVGFVAAVLMGTGCGGDDDPGTVLTSAEFPAALVALPDGGLLYGERLTGRIRRVDANGVVEPDPVATVDVSTQGQRGLLGLAAEGERVFAAWTDVDQRLVVAQVAPGSARVVWVGPDTTELANGGRLAFAPDGRLVIGIGDLQAPALVNDPNPVNGKLLALDADAGPEQVPDVVSGGWNNPFAFAFTPTGDLWVADNSPGEDPERLTRGDGSGPVTELPTATAPSGLAATDGGDLLVCGYVSGQLLRYEVVDGRAERRTVLADDCRLGVVVLDDGRIVYAAENSLHVLDP